MSRLAVLLLLVIAVYAKPNLFFSKESSTTTTTTPTTTTTAPTTVARDAMETVTQSIVEVLSKEKACDDKWLRYKNSCYYIERTQMMSMKEAEAYCFGKNATLFVADDLDEFNAIMKKATVKYYWTWSGLYKKSDSNAASWNTDSNMKTSDLPFLFPKNTDQTNGYTSVSQCAAYYNYGVDNVQNYLYYYNCDYKFYFVCEKNQDLMAQKTSTRFF